MNLIPDFIIGDLDSVKAAVLKKFSDVSEIIKLPRQNDTDVEKCLKFVIRNKYTDAGLTGVTGDRLDHTFCNLGIVIKFYYSIRISIIAEHSVLQPYTGYNELQTVPGETISIYGLDPDTKILSKGLKYKLNNIPLPFGQKESTSNIAVADRISLNVNNGIIFVIRDYNVMKKNGLLYTA